MSINKEKKHWFLKYPLVPAFVLPIMAIVGVSLLSQLITGVLPMVFGDGIREFKELPDILHSALRILLAFAIIWVMKLTSGGQFQFGFTKRNLWQSIALATVLALVILDNIVECSIAGIPLQNTFSGIAIALLSGFAPGFFEEVVCRSVVLGNMMQRWKNQDNYILKSVLVSGIAFGLVHIINILNGDISATLLQVCYASGLGIFLGSIYLRTRNIWGPVILHSLVDFSAYIFNGEPDTTTFTIVTSFAITVIYIAGGLFLVRPSKRREIHTLWEEPEII